MSSASTEACEKKQKKKSGGFGILAIAKRRASRKQKSQSVSPSTSSKSETSILSEGVDYTEISLQRTSPQSLNAKLMAAEAQVVDLSAQLDEARAEVEALQSANKDDKATISQLETTVKLLQADSKKLEKKVSEFEKVGKELDDDSFATAHEFQLKKDIGELKEEVGKLQEIKDELAETKVELQETRAQYEQLEAETKRSTTRSKISSISDDKRARDEVARLQKDLRQMDRKLQADTAHMQAQLKASQDSLQRAQDKTIHMHRRVDAIDKEKLELKIENQRLTKKLEKQGSFSEKKRLELEKESHELELSNLRRKTSKLEKRLSMSQQLLDSVNSPPRSDIMSPDGIRSPTSTIDTASVVSPIPETLSESRIRHQEEELAQLVTELRQLRKENERLQSEIAAGGKQSLPNADPKPQLNAIPEVQDSGRVEELEKLLAEEKQRCVGLQAEVEEFQSRVAGGSEEAYVQELQHKYDKLQKAYEDKETQLRVQTKTWKATNDELKRQMEELEIAKLKAELGEGEEGEDEDTDTEESAEISGLRERLNSVQSELTVVQAANEELKVEIEKQKQEETTEVSGLRERLNSVQLELTTFQSTNEELKMEIEKNQQGESTDVSNLRARLNSVQLDLTAVQTTNEELKSEVEKRKQEANEFMKSIEQELTEVAVFEEPKEERLKKKNAELNEKLTEQMQMHENAIHEITRLKITIVDQDDDITLMATKIDELKATTAELRAQVEAAKRQQERKAPISNGGVSPGGRQSKKVQATGGVQMIIGSKKAEKAKERQPPATKKKPSKEARQKTASTQD